MKTSLASCLVVITLLGANRLGQAADPAHPDQPLVAPAEALSRLREGNARFTAGNPQHPHESADERKRMATDSYENAGALPLGMTSEQAAKRRAELAKSQHPFAIILSCSDSRVPPEIVFDEGLGDLFIVRVAGNVLNDEGLGSIEYGVEVLGARLNLRCPLHRRARPSELWCHRCRNEDRRCERQSTGAYSVTGHGHKARTNCDAKR